MNEVHKSALVAFPVDGMFDLIEAAENYPLFLPWCAGATVLARDDNMVSARIAVDYHGLRFHIVTRNPKRRPDYMAIHLEQGPFRQFSGEWSLVKLADNACKVEFYLRYEFKSATVAGLAGPVFDRIAGTLVDAFVGRAEAVYGGNTTGGS